jgi:pimeloyl-ACP methyl ester carboxylesterase
LVIAMAASAMVVGCAGNYKYMTEERQSRGLVVILPGIEGTSPFNRHIRQGLADAGVDCATPICSWGWPVPLVGMALNQSDPICHHLAGKRIARMIAKYEDEHPGQPVYIIGHSGGAGIAVFAAEDLAAMEGDHKIQGLVLLSASISADYDLTTAIGQCRCGIVNFYNRDDKALLLIGTAIAGNVDGGHGDSAGRTGFGAPSGNNPQAPTAYARLYQIELTEDMAEGKSGGIVTCHTTDTGAAFVEAYVADWVKNNVWPPASVTADLQRH